MSVIEIARQIDDAFDQKRNFVHTEDRNAQVDLHHGSGKKLEDVLGFTPSCSFEDGLRETIAWYRENVEHWKPQIPMRRVPVKMKNGEIEWY